MTGDQKITFDVAELQGMDGYKLGSGLIVPRPIGWIGTLGPDGVPNLAPYSFFNMMSGAESGWSVELLRSETTIDKVDRDATRRLCTPRDAKEGVAGCHL